MRKLIWLIAAAALLALAATVTVANGDVVLWDRYGVHTGYGYCMVLKADGTQWLIHYLDNPRADAGTIGVYDPNIDVLIWQVEVCRTGICRQGGTGIGPNPQPIPLGSG